MRKLFAVTLIAFMEALTLGTCAHAEKRVALVIGNSAYSIGPLRNPGNDALAMAKTLNGLGFATTLYRDLGLDGMRQALREFGTAALGAEVAAVFFAGHGLEIGGRNYLVPVDARLQRAGNIDLEAITLDTVLQQLEGVNRLRLVILDACRNNIFPLAGSRRALSRGLSRIEPDDNTLVVYAAKDGTTADDGDGDNSPFTGALIRHLPTPGLDIGFVFRRVRDDVVRATGGQQQPHTYGSLGGEAIYLRVDPEASLVAVIEAERARLAAERLALELERRRIAALETPARPTTPATPPPSNDTPRLEALFEEFSVAPEIRRMLATHPAFARPPQTRTVDYVMEIVGKDTMVTSRVRMTPVGRGVHLMEIKNSSSGYDATMRSLVTWYGLINLGQRSTTTGTTAGKRWTSQDVMQATTLEVTSEPILRVGAAFGHSTGFKQETRHSSDPTRRLEYRHVRACRVLRSILARDFHESLPGDASVVECQVGTTGSSKVKVRYVLFDHLGIVISADPASGKERLVDPQFGSRYLLKEIRFP